MKVMRYSCYLNQITELCPENTSDAQSKVQDINRSSAESPLCSHIHYYFLFLFFLLSTETKFSRHLIFQPEDTTFTDNVTAGMLSSAIPFESGNRATGGWLS